MNTKQFILMMLVMLGSVTGAWATDTGADIFSTMCLETQNIKVTPAGVIDGTHVHTLVIWKDNNKTKIEAKNGVKIKQILLQGCTGVGISYGVSASGASEIINDVEGFYTINFTNGVTSTIIGPGNGYPGNIDLCAITINVTYEYPDHTHSYAGNWTHDDECHWHECTSLIGLCKDNQGSKAPHNYGDSGEAYYTCQTCGYVNEQRKHVHVPADTWSYDAIQHWHECTSQNGICTDRKLELASHTYNNTDLTDDTKAYTCSTCGYVNEAVKAQFDAREYLSLKAVGGDVTIALSKTGTPANYTIQWSSDGNHWCEPLELSESATLTTIPAGQTCYFRHGTATAINGINTDGNYWTFTMTGTGTIEADGSIMSLLDGTTQKTNLAAFAFANLFKGCGKLTKAPKLLATSTSTRCYKGMFEETGITEAPALPAARVVKGAYENMFMNCQNLEKAPTLLATRVDWTGYQNMFNGCKKITEITLGNIETIENGNAFSHWLDGTAYETEGTLITPDAMVGQVPMPSNWQYKQIKDYTTAVSNAMEGTTSVIQNIGQDYIAQIKQATSNDAALSLRDEALSDINTLKKYNSKLDASSFTQPTGVGMRLKVTKKDGNVYEFKTQDVESVDYYRVNE